MCTIPLGHEGQGHVEGHLHERLAWYVNLVQGGVLVLDPEDHELEPGHGYLGMAVVRQIAQQMLLILLSLILARVSLSYKSCSS